MIEREQPVLRLAYVIVVEGEPLIARIHEIIAADAST
jgi:hypothetical protein